MISKEEIQKILEIVQKAKEEAGQKIVLGTLFQDGEETILVDNREDQHNN